MNVLSSSVPDDIDAVTHNRAAWDELVEQDDEWSRPVGYFATRALKPGPSSTTPP